MRKLFSPKIVRNLLKIYLIFYSPKHYLAFLNICGKSTVMAFREKVKESISLSSLNYCYAKFVAFQENQLQVLWKKKKKLEVLFLVIEIRTILRTISLVYLLGTSSFIENILNQVTILN